MIFGLLANTLNADLGMLPGLAVIGPGLRFPVSALAAFLERPFYFRAGVSRATIWYSLQANFVSHLLGIVYLFLVFALAGAMSIYQAPFLVWPFLAVGLSTLIEGQYLRRKISPSALGWWWVAGGNVFSAAFSVALIFGIVFVREAYPSQVRVLIPLQLPLYFGSLIGSLALFLVSFRMTRTRKNGDSAGNAAAPPDQEIGTAGAD